MNHLVEMPLESAKELLERASCFDFHFAGPTGHLTPIQVVRRSGHGVEPVTWAVVYLSTVLNNEDQWEYEPIPGARDDDFIARTRFDLITAVCHAKAWVERLNENPGAICAETVPST